MCLDLSIYMVFFEWDAAWGVMRRTLSAPKREPKRMVLHRVPFLSVLGRFWRPSGPKDAPKTRPRRSRTAKMLSRRPQDTFRFLQNVPRRLQDAPRLPEVAPKTGSRPQDAPTLSTLDSKRRQALWPRFKHTLPIITFQSSESLNFSFLFNFFLRFLLSGDRT